MTEQAVINQYEKQKTDDQVTAKLIEEAWMEVFPNGKVGTKKVLGTYMVTLYLQNKWENNISDNDPLSYAMRVEGENCKEWKLHVLTKPSEGTNLVYDSKGKRKQTIKEVTKEKLVKRFKKIKEWIKSLELKHEVKL